MVATLQATTAIPVLEAPPRLNEEFAVAMAELEFAGGCIASYPNRRLDAKYRTISDRNAFDRMRAEEIWGTVETGMGEEDYPDTPAACARAKVESALARASAALDRAKSSVEQAAEPMKRGLWTGALKLCRDTVSSTRIGQDAFFEEPVVLVLLTAAGRQALADLTRKSVGVALVIRADGAIVSEPRVNEPVEGGMIQIQARDTAMLDRVRSLAGDDC